MCNVCEVMCNNVKYVIIILILMCINVCNNVY